MRKRLIQLLALLFGVLSFASAQTLPRDVRERIIKATVMINPATAKGEIIGTGTGTIISPLGYILTNYHVIGDNETRQYYPLLAIGIIKFVDQEPQPTYLGKVVAADPNLDLAIVKIASDLKGNAVGTLNLPFMELGDSNNLLVGDPLFVFGFQSTGGNTLSFSKGSVSGFTGEDRASSGKAWVKHDAQTGPGNSGGGAYDENGVLMGVHSAGVAGDHNSRTAFMRPLSLAWGLITPNVPRFVVKGQGGTPVAGGSGTSGGGSGGASGSGTTPPPSGTSSGGSGAWPPAIVAGQAGQITFKTESSTGTWALNLNQKDPDGGIKGKAQGSDKEYTAFMYFDQKNDRVWIDLVVDSKTTLSCAFDQAGVRSSTWAGKSYLFQDGSSNGQRVGDCTAALRAGSAGGGGSGQGTTTGPTQGTQALTWPLKTAAGQNWEFNIQTLGVWKLSLNATSQKGNPMGPVISPKNEKWTGFFYYQSKDNTAWFDMTSDGKAYVSCLFESGSVSGRTLRGTAYYFEDENSDGEKVGTCTATLR